MVEIHLRGRVLPDGRRDLLRFLVDAIPFYEAPGGIHVRLLWNTTEPERFIEVIGYDSRSAYEADRARVASDPTMMAYLDRWRALLAEPPIVETYAVDPQPDQGAE